MTITYLHDLIKEKYKYILHDVPFKNLRGVKMAIDTSIIINKYRHVPSIFDSILDKSDLINHGVNEDELSAIIINRISTLIISCLNNGVLPVFVIDGQAYPLKVLHERKKRKENNKSNKHELEQILEFARKSDNNTREIYMSKIKSLYKKAYRPSNYFYNKIYKFLQATKLPCYQAKYEADAVLGYLSNNGIVDLVYSNDSDMYANKCPYIMKDFNKGSGPDGRTCIISRSDDLIRALNYTKDEFTDFCILLGCDMNEKIKGIGKVAAKSLIDKFRRIDNINTRDVSSLNHRECYQVFNSHLSNFDDICVRYQELNLDDTDFTELEHIVIEYSIPKFVEDIKAHYEHIAEYKKFNNEKRHGYIDELKILENVPSTSNVIISNTNMTLSDNLLSNLDIPTTTNDNINNTNTNNISLSDNLLQGINIPQSTINYNYPVHNTQYVGNTQQINLDLSNINLSGLSVNQP